MRKSVLLFLYKRKFRVFDSRRNDGRSRTEGRASRIYSSFNLFLEWILLLINGQEFIFYLEILWNWPINTKIITTTKEWYLTYSKVQHFMYYISSQRVLINTLNKPKGLLFCLWLGFCGVAHVLYELRFIIFLFNAYETCYWHCILHKSNKMLFSNFASCCI